MTEPVRLIGPWRLTDLKTIRSNNITVFSCFHCGGGSTMGYKLAGCEVLGGVEIDRKMMELYRINHRPRHSFLMSIQDFNALSNDRLPSELFDLDILDGSPPCSVFSTAGKREKKWGKKSVFREGQSRQRLDDLFAHFIVTARKLRPKIVIAENVKGMVMGRAKGFVREIFCALKEAGYETQLFLLNAATMGVPQKRQRLFFIARRRDLDLPSFAPAFAEPMIPFGRIKHGSAGPDLSVKHRRLWQIRRFGDRSLQEANVRATGVKALWSWCYLYDHLVMHTLDATRRPVLFSECRLANDVEIRRMQSFPEDYDARDEDIGYVCGMSVPPFMMQRLSLEICRQMFGRDYDRRIVDRFVCETVAQSVPLIEAVA